MVRVISPHASEPVQGHGCLIHMCMCFVCLQTSGVDLVVKVVNIPDSDTAVELYLHDTAGSDLYASMRPALVYFYMRCKDVL
jgi:hypothetical protein